MALAGVSETRLELITAPSADPVSLALTKNQLRVDHNDDDNLIALYLGAAVRYAQEVTNREFLLATYDLKLDEFSDSIELPRPPLSSVSQISYVDPDGVTQVLASSVYDVDTTVDPGVVTLAFDQSWPSIRSVRNAVVIRFVAGWTNAAAVPKTIKEAILLLVDHWYTRRSPVHEFQRGGLLDVPLTVNDLLGLERVEGAQ